MLKKVLSLIIPVMISMILVVSFVILPTQAAEPPQPQEAPMLPPPEQPPPVIDGHGTGFLPPPMDLSHLTGQEMPEGFMVGQPPLGGPSSFDWRTQGKVTPVKNQGSCGSDYAFAAVANFESEMLIDGAAILPNPDYSENNAKECNWRARNNYGGSCNGGNYFMLASLWSQTGVVLESYDPYVASDVPCKCIDTCPYQKTLLGWSIISGNEVPAPDVLKAYIYQQASPVYTTLWVDAGEGFDITYDGTYTFNYATPPASGTNHVVLIVGWSDNLPPVPGGTTPADGWIVKNSWGSTWGDNGYFYITYGSANIGMYSSFMYDWQDYDRSGGIMYYDDDYGSTAVGCGTTTCWGLCKFIPTTDTCVTRVEFWTTDKTTDVDVYIYDDFDGTTLSNKLWESLDNSFEEAGYHGVAVNAPLPLTAGDDVIAVVKFSNNSFTYPVPMDMDGPYETERTYISCSGSNGPWTDAGTTFNCDVAIRLRTSLPDLVVSKSVDISGGNFTVSYNVSNIGNATANASITCKYLNGVLMETRPCPPLAPGENYSGQFDPEPCPCGESLNITVCADNDDAVAESSEANNCELNIVDCPATPDISVFPSSFDVTLPPDTAKDYTLAINNDGCAALSYNISDAEAGGDCPWLGESPASGLVGPGGSQNVSVSINTTGLGSDYTAEIVIASNDPDEDPTVVPVTLHVVSLDLVVEKSVDISGGNFTVSYNVSNIGNATANASSTGKYVNGTLMESQPCPALGPGENYSGQFDPEPCPCGESLNVTVCADNGDAVAESNEANNCELNIVDCPATPDISVFPSSFDVTLPPDTAKDYTLAIGNDGCAALSYNISDREGGGDCPWLGESPASGSVGPGGSQNITVSINTTGLGSDYTAEIVIASNDPDEYPVIVPVTLHVSAQPPTVGGEAYPVNKASILAPWIAVAALLAGGMSWLTLRRRRAQS